MLSGYIMLPSPLPRYIRAGLIETFEVKHSDFLSGRGVTNPAFTGSVAELDSEFVTHVRPFLLAVLAWSSSIFGVSRAFYEMFIKSYSDVDQSLAFQHST